MASPNNRYDTHISAQYNAELEDVRQRVLAMGGMVEHQVTRAMQALLEIDSDLAREVIENDHRVNGMEVHIDEECSRILARRQPAASDLRLIVAVIKTITDLERIGDEAERIARMSLDLAELDAPRGPHFEIETLGRQVQTMLHDVLDAFARMDPEAALAAAQHDIRIDREYESIMRQCITFMIEDPRSISRVFDIVWSLRSLERIGDHARNIAEYVIYFVHGKDVRHISLEQVAEELGAEPLSKD
ncbi:Phosphate transport system regulatory protein PhoU [Oceanococcus atlanticus]|uniref:Phosphate-specific transport system accessory protein PhoU n=1 Tax=Oceanococcus atlanticus TaxID=1317117 RepID=A0A1Y1SC48_9GAMM|nr:phosphate signaling complex protein PhoU [Oceanococcus atlanticus]ORE86220.1 Phosphate transport system regulatory protein PhoU [Oceanococcus atlanticus]RZO85978.1 MAG: phosphate signaling complex protein PhoU [Oceanococcus sp.]